MAEKADLHGMAKTPNGPNWEKNQNCPKWPEWADWPT